MFNKASLKQKHNVIAVLMSALLAVGVLMGCGAKAADPGGSTETSGEAQPVVLKETEQRGVSEDMVEASEEALPDFAYKTVEDRMKQGRHKSDTQNPSNKFFMIESISTEPLNGYPDNYGEITAPCEEFPRGVYADSGYYVRYIGTLYELFHDGKPANGSVYFPGDELPEGYTVEVTEGYEFAYHDFYNLDGDGVKMVSTKYVVTDDGTGHMSYVGKLDHEEAVLVAVDEGDIHLTKEEVEALDNEEAENWKADPTYGHDEFIKKAGFHAWGREYTPGMYFQLNQYAPMDPEVIAISEAAGIEHNWEAINSVDYELYQILTKEDMEKLPKGAVLDEDIIHY